MYGTYGACGVPACGGYGAGRGFIGSFAFILVLFILLAIIGAVGGFGAGAGYGW